MTLRQNMVTITSKSLSVDTLFPNLGFIKLCIFVQGHVRVAVGELVVALVRVHRQLEVARVAPEASFVPDLRREGEREGRGEGGHWKPYKNAVYTWLSWGVIVS